MNIPFLIAGVLCIVATPAHILGGESTLRQVTAQAFPKIANGNSTVAKQEIRMGWHLFDIDLIFGGIALMMLATTDIFDTPHTIAHLLGLYYAGYSVIILASTLGIPSRDRIIRLPQWILTGVIAGLTLYGATIL